MGATVIINFRTVVHKGSGGTAPSVPDACKTPAPPGPPVPIPYPNVARSSDTDKGSKKVKMDGKPIMLKNSKFSTSVGDEAGTLKGIASNTNKGIAKFANYSFDVKVEGKNVPRLGDPMTNNGNGPNSAAVAELQATTGVAVAITPEELETICNAICDCDAKGEKTDCVMKELTKGPPNHIPKHKHIHCEQSYNMTTTPPSLIKSTSLRSPSGVSISSNVFGAMGKMSGFPRGSMRRPDIVLTNHAGRLAQGSNVRQVVDIKFPPDDWRDGQRQAYQKLNPNAPEPIALGPDECKCP
jgi:hypothetical protein